MASTAELAARKESIPVDSLPESLKIVDCEKRRGVSRYYCYIIEVTRKNGTVYHVYRRYRQFDKMVTRLEERFPVEAGSIRASDRIIPLLPGKKYAKRSAVRNIAEERLPLLNEFLQKLYAMSDKIRYDSIVIAFLKQSHEDISNPYKPNIAYPSRKGPPPIRPPKSPRTTGRSSTSPSRPPPPTKSLPSIHVTSSSGGKPMRPHPPRPSPPPAAKKGTSLSTNTPRAKALYTYKTKYDDELAFTEGSVLTLIRKVNDNWYQCKYNDNVGMTPANYLKIIQPLPEDEDNNSSEDEWDDEEYASITCRYKGKNTSIEVDADLIRRPVYSKLMFVIKDHLKDSKIVLNYKDSTGDLIEIVDSSDLQIMIEEGSRSSRGYLKVPSSGSSANDWTIYVTTVGDTSVYHTHPYKKPRPV